MERYTRRTDGGIIMRCTGCEFMEKSCNWKACRNRLKDRLCEYEDTIPLERARELAEAERDGRLAVLPEVPEADRQAFVDGLHDYFQEAANHDPSVGIFGMRDGEAELAKALMDALRKGQETVDAVARAADVEPVKRRRWTPPLLDDIKSAGFYERCSALWKSVGVPLPRKKRKQDGQGTNQTQKEKCLLLPQLNRERKSEAEEAYLLSVLVREFNAGDGLNVKVADRIAELAHMRAKEGKHGTTQA